MGRDQLARLMQGMLISLTVALLVEVVDIGLGVTVGVLAGFYGGWIDQLLARFTDIMFAFPGLLFAILLTGIFGQEVDTSLAGIPIIGPNGNARLALVSLALAFTAWPLMARYVRGQTLQLKEQQFVEAARTSGTRNHAHHFAAHRPQPVQHRGGGLNAQYRRHGHRRSGSESAGSGRAAAGVQSGLDDFGCQQFAQCASL